MDGSRTRTQGREEKEGGITSHYEWVISISVKFRSPLRCAHWRSSHSSESSLMRLHCFMASKSDFAPPYKLSRSYALFGEAYTLVIVTFAFLLWWTTSCKLYSRREYHTSSKACSFSLCFRDQCEYVKALLLGIWYSVRNFTVLYYRGKRFCFQFSMEAMPTNPQSPRPIL